MFHEYYAFLEFPKNKRRASKKKSGYIEERGVKDQTQVGRERHPGSNGRSTLDNALFYLFNKYLLMFYYYWALARLRIKQRLL